MSLAASTSPVGVPANVVLIVDDDAAMLIMLELILAREGIRVVRAHDGKEALHCLKNVDLPDLILTDLNMAGMGGEEFLTRVKKDARTKKVPVIVISGVDDLEAKSTHLGENNEEALSSPSIPRRYSWRRLRPRNE